jgi:alkylation response protein AidB-like acyl-CoA dehydrogenase
MDLNFTKEEIAFRDEVRDFFAKNVPAETKPEADRGRKLEKADIVDWQRILNKKGWAVYRTGRRNTAAPAGRRAEIHLPGRIAARARAGPAPFGVSMVGPVIYAFGNEQQKKHFLPRIANLDDWWCQGFSEPGAGSDLAGLSTKAVREGDHWIINGQKTWTTLAQYADWIFVLARTDTKAKKQEGISFILCDMKTPGITVRPIQLIDGGKEVNEVFFDNVKVPYENLVGQENRGWDYAKFLLGNERTGIARVGISKERIRRLKGVGEARTFRRQADDRRPALPRENLAVEVELKALEMTQMRVVAAEGKRGATTSRIRPPRF